MKEEYIGEVDRKIKELKEEMLRLKREFTEELDRIRREGKNLSSRDDFKRLLNEINDLSRRVSQSLNSIMKESTTLMEEITRDIHEALKRMDLEHSKKLEKTLIQYREDVKRMIDNFKNFAVLFRSEARALSRELWENMKGISWTTVSTVRLSREDMDVINMLVDAGVFRTRSEAIAFFVHKGIEASRDWLSEFKSKIEELKKVRDEILRRIKGSVENSGKEIQ
ncbi:MAG: hypothetical protein DRJ47_04915 [Thermoprotei archaeon]|nr:MAG: hypothetical protein DRJ47_04915 [Thermoprotei archaeon]